MKKIVPGYQKGSRQYRALAGVPCVQVSGEALDGQKKTAPEVPFLRYVSPALIQLYHIITTVAVNQFDKRIDTRKHRLFIQREGDNIFA